MPAASLEEATVFENRYCKLLGELCDIRTQTKDQYWKIETLYELFFRCTARDDEYQVFLQMADRIGARPSESSDVEFIWSTNTDPSTFVIIAGTYWAHLALEESLEED